jgi:predicted PurR-regulated permease PerM
MNEDIKQELEKTNKLLERHVKISTRIFKTFYLRSFLSGVLSALGALFATSVLTGLIIYYIAQLPYIKEIQPFIEQYSKNIPAIEKSNDIPTIENSDSVPIIEKNVELEYDQF